ncbi:alcohol dehydrogenase catalytic domain-containing protein [Demequina flava]|uniref:alcohol dehydrogenase catalytic domain-containing protein n=1 Tax=Demequina flava TaxID=1095025 RepID=UPI000785CDFE|nr:alcohol dehydrogenase catalytic domain-containing protein [Demequina flava]
MPAPHAAVAVTARALVSHDGAVLDTLTLPVPDLSPGEILVAMHFGAVCGCVVDMVEQQHAGAHPAVLGHEGVGVIEAIGRGEAAVAADGTLLAPGMRVVWGRNAGCGRCQGCATGRACRNPTVLGEAQADAEVALSGSLTTHAVLPPTAVVAIVPRSIPDMIAVPAGCAVASVCSVIDTAGPLAGKRVLVLGAGMQGLVAVAMVAEAGASSITIVEPDPQRRQRALEFGADAALDPATGLARADVVIDVSGGAAALAAASDALDTGGVLVVGRTRARVAHLHLDMARLSREALSVRGAPHVGPHHLLAALDFLAGTHATRDWGSLMAPPVALESVTSELPYAEGQHARALISPR